MSRRRVAVLERGKQSARSYQLLQGRFQNENAGPARAVAPWWSLKSSGRLRDPCASSDKSCDMWVASFEAYEKLRYPTSLEEGGDARLQLTRTPHRLRGRKCTPWSSANLRGMHVSQSPSTL